MLQGSLGEYVLTFFPKVDNHIANLIDQVLVIPGFEQFSLFIPDGFLYLRDFVLGSTVKNCADIFLQEREDAVLF